MNLPITPDIKIYEDCNSYSYIKVKNITINNLDSFPIDIKNKLNILFVKFPFLNSIEQFNVPVDFINNKTQVPNDEILRYKQYVVKTINEKLSSVHFSETQKDKILSNIQIEFSICTESNFISSI